MSAESLGGEPPHVPMVVSDATGGWSEADRPGTVLGPLCRSASGFHPHPRIDACLDMVEPLSYPPFPGFHEDAFQFLRDLDANNDRDWFKARKEVYETELKTPLELLLADGARRLDAADLPLTADPKRSRVRIYRDIRFTDDKTPYKTHVAGVFDRSGEKDQDGLVYVHVEPGNCFLAAGFYQPSVSYLRPVRQRMAENPESFFGLLDEMESRGLSVNSADETLTGMPQGFSDSRDADVAPYLKWKHYVVDRQYEEADLQSPDFVEEIVRMTEEVLPLLRYVWEAQQDD